MLALRSLQGFVRASQRVSVFRSDVRAGSHARPLRMSMVSPHFTWRVGRRLASVRGGLWQSVFVGVPVPQPRLERCLRRMLSAMRDSCCTSRSWDDIWRSRRDVAAVIRAKAPFAMTSAWPPASAGMENVDGMDGVLDFSWCPSGPFCPLCSWTCVSTWQRHPLCVAAGLSTPHGEGAVEDVNL